MSAGDLDILRGVVSVPAGTGTGVSATTGATGIGMEILELPPGRGTGPRLHLGFETAVYVVDGTVEVRHGADLRHRARAERGEFLFVAGHVPHELVNPDARETARVVVARNTAQADGSVERYAPRPFHVPAHHESLSLVERLAAGRA